jgi:hypothetical protein
VPRIALVVGSVISILCSVSVAAEDVETLFERRIAPVLEQRCASCHNPDKREGGLDVTSRDSLLKGGDSGAAVVAGKLDESILLDMVTGAKPEIPKNAKPLTEDEIAVLRQWIKDGADWSDGVKISAELWSLRRIARPEQPATRDADWVKTPIDAFIAKRLEADELRPAPRADRLTLLRRATFDLHGLPPTPQEIDDFLVDQSENAFAKVIDRLLDSPRYGERWGRHWLDLANYADSHGFELDYAVSDIERGYSSAAEEGVGMLRRCAAWGFGVLIVVAFLNSIALAVYATAIGGASVYQENGRYFVNSYGRFTEVSEGQASWVRAHKRAVFVTHALAILVGGPLLMYAVRDRTPGRPAEPAAAPERGGM